MNPLGVRFDRDDRRLLAEGEPGVASAIRQDGTVDWTAFFPEHGSIFLPYPRRDGSFLISTTSDDRFELSAAGCLIESHSANVVAIRDHPSGFRVRSLGDGSLEAVSPSGVPLWLFRNPSGRLMTWLIVGSDRSLLVGEVSSGFEIVGILSLSPSGDLLWQESLPTACVGLAAGNDDTVYCWTRASLDSAPIGNLHAVRAGNLLWTLGTTGKVVVAPDGTLVVSEPYALVARDPATGLSKWMASAELAISGSACIGRDGSIYYATLHRSDEFGAETTVWQLSSEGVVVDSITVDEFPASSLEISWTGLLGYRSTSGGLVLIESDSQGPGGSNWPTAAHDPSATFFLASFIIPPPRTFFSGAAHAPGREGTSWRTDLTVANLTDRSVPAWLRFAADGGSGMDDAMIPVELPPLSSQRFDDVVRTTFGLDGVAGTVGLACAYDGVVSTARTYNDDSAGSYGQRLAPFDWKDALRFTEEGVLFPLRHESAAEPGWRTNVGISNDSPSGGTFRLDYLGAAGELLGSETLAIAGYGVLRLDNAFRRVTEADVPFGAVRVSGLEAGLALVPWASVVDNGTGDAVFLPSVKTSPCLPPTAATASLELAPSASSSDLYFPGFARAPGANGTTWRSELALWNDGDTAAPVELVWYAEGESPSNAQRSTLLLAAGEARRIGDVVGEVFGRDGRGTLGVNVAGAPIRTSGRVFTSDSRGSYGQAVPPVASADLLRLGQKGALLALSHRVSLDGGFRTNVGLWNGGSTGKVELAFHRENGETLGCRTIDLPALSSVRLDGVLAEWAADELVGAYATIDLSPTGAPAIAAWASTVDNRTGDAVFQPAQWHGGMAGGCE